MGSYYSINKYHNYEILVNLEAFELNKTIHGTYFVKFEGNIHSCVSQSQCLFDDNTHFLLKCDDTIIISIKFINENLIKIKYTNSQSNRECIYNVQVNDKNKYYNYLKEMQKYEAHQFYLYERYNISEKNISI